MGAIHGADQGDGSEPPKEVAGSEECSVCAADGGKFSARQPTKEVAGAEEPGDQDLLSEPDDGPWDVRAADAYFSFSSGPVPSPESVMEYNQIEPGLGVELVRLGVDMVRLSIEETRHRQHVDIQAIDATREENKRDDVLRDKGQFRAFWASIAGFICATMIGMSIGGLPGAAAASIIGGSTIAVIVTAMTRPRRNGRGE